MALRALAGVASATISLANIDAGLGISDYYYRYGFATSRGAAHWHALGWAPVRQARLYSDSLARARAAVQIQCACRRRQAQGRVDFLSRVGPVPRFPV